MFSLRNTPKTWLMAGSSLALVAGAAWGVSAYLSHPRDPFGLPPELSAQNLKAESEDPAKMMQAMRDLRQRTDLTEEQRREAMRRMFEERRAREEQRINEYFAAAEAQRQAILDRQIDEMQRQREEWERAREQWDREHPTTEPASRPARPDFTSLSRQEQKTRAESRDPDAMARNMAYRAALRARMEERGIQPPRGPWGGGGPGGGGFRGRGGR